MKQRPEIDRVLQVWMADGPTAIPDRVVDVVAARIQVQRQRRAWPFPGRTTVNTQIKLIAGLAAALVVAVVAWQLLPAGHGTGSNPTASPPTAAPTATPIAAAPVELPQGILTGGRYLMQPLDDPSTLRIVADIPAGWQSFESKALVSPGETSNTGILLGFMVTDGLFSDACHWDLDGSGNAAQPGDVVVGPTVGELVAALEANSSYASSPATPITIGGIAGQQIEIQIPGDDVLSTCDREPGDNQTYRPFPGGFYAQSPDSRWRLYIVDVDGTRLITMVSIAEGMPQADIGAAEAIVESFDFTP